MNSFERILATLNHERVDRVPVYPILSGVSRSLVGADYKTWSTDSEVCANALIAAQKEFDLDCVCTLIDLSLEADAWGIKVIYPENEAAHPDYNNRIINQIEDYAKIEKVDYRSSERMMMHIDTCRKLVERIGKEVPIIAFVFGPLGVLSMMRNQQDMYMDLYDDPDAVKHAAAQINETLKEYCAALMDVGVHAIMLDTLFASASIMSKEMWLEMEGGLVKELADTIHERGRLVMIHNCGFKIYFDAQIQTMRPQAISFLHPPDDCKDFEECKEKYGKDLTLIGCVPPPMAATGTDEEWIAACKQSIDVLGRDSGFLLATGCEYPANAPLCRAKLMVEVAKSHLPKFDK